MTARSAVLALFLSVGASTADAQTFSSGSTGADGALDLSTTCIRSSISADTSCYVQLPPDGVLHYTTINVPTGRTLRFKKNLNNTPVVLLAQGDVTIGGLIFLNAGEFDSGGVFQTDAPGPGGFRGGPQGQPGFGPGGGQPTAADRHGRWIGPLSLVPIIGGSGGGGYAGIGYGGGGAIVIASSQSITLSGAIQAIGGSWSGTNAGSGGAIRLVANSLIVTGGLHAYGGSGQSFQQGLIRLEAPAGALTFTGGSNPSAVLATINPAILPAATPSLSIVSVGGYQVPSYSGQRFDTVDLVLPMQLPDPIDVVVAASNIPIGTQIKINFGTTNVGTVTPGTLSGSMASSNAVVKVSGLNRTQLSYLFVYANFDVPSGASTFNPPGPDHVSQVRIAAPPGGAPQFAFLRSDGSTVDRSRLKPGFLKQFVR